MGVPRKGSYGWYISGKMIPTVKIPQRSLVITITSKIDSELSEMIDELCIELDISKTVYTRRALETQVKLDRPGWKYAVRELTEDE